MRKWIHEFFHVSKDGKVREKALLGRATLTIITVLLCLAALTFTAYAYFSCNVTSGPLAVRAASFEMEITVQSADGSVSTTTVDNKLHTVTLDAGKEYTVTISPATSSTAKTGYIVITANGCNETYHTQQLGLDASVTGGETRSITFRLQISAPTQVQLQANWGTSSYYDDYVENGDQEALYITQNEQLTMTVNGVTNQLVNTDPINTEPTEPAPTENSTEPSTEPTTDNNTAPSAEPTTDDNTEPSTEPADDADKPTVVPSETSGAEEQGTSEPTIPATQESTEPQTEPTAETG